MTPGVAQRLLVLAGAALLALVVALAVASIAGGSDDGDEPGSVPAPGGRWYSALAGRYSFKAGTRRTACGHPASAELEGVAHPVLPCGAKLVLRYREVEAITQVVDRGPVGRGREFGVTRSLAVKIGLGAVDRVRWRFAAEEE